MVQPTTMAFSSFFSSFGYQLILSFEWKQADFSLILQFLLLFRVDAVMCMGVAAGAYILSLFAVRWGFHSDLLCLQCGDLNFSFSF